MNKLSLILLTAATLLFTVIGAWATPARAGDDPCTKDMKSNACEVFLRQQSAPSTNPKSDGTPARCVWVTAGQASALVLREGRGVDGPPITSWRLANLDWKSRIVNGYPSLMTQICFSKGLLYQYDVVSLCGAVGHSVWRNENMTYVRKHDVGRFDPACVGGKGWCSLRGL